MNATTDFPARNDQPPQRLDAASGEVSVRDSAGAATSAPAILGGGIGHTGQALMEHDGVSAAASAKKYTGKPKKIIRGEQSFRPGSTVATSKPRKPKALLYSIPTANGRGDQGEFSALHSFLHRVDDRLNQGQFGRFATLGLEDGCWKLSFRLNQGEDEVQDAFVSSMFQALDEVNRGTSFLSEGFGTSRPASWAVTVGECVVDRGSF